MFLFQKLQRKSHYSSKPNQKAVQNNFKSLPCIYFVYSFCIREIAQSFDFKSKLCSLTYTQSGRFYKQGSNIKQNRA